MRNFSTEMQFPAELRQQPGRGADHDIRAAFAERHLETLIRHGFEIGKQRAAGDAGREIEMHAPGADRRLDLLVLKVAIEKIAR
jgi:hypothetical protein